MKKKSEVSHIFSRFKASVEKYFIQSIASFYWVNCGEFIYLKYFFSYNGIYHFLTPSYTPEHNGVAKKLHRHIVETGTTILHNAN